MRCCLGHRLWKYADSIGAILISIYIIFSWFKAGWGKFVYLVISYTVNILTAALLITR